MPDKNGIPTEKEIYDALMPKADDPRIQKKPVKVIKKGDMSPETKALPDEVVAPPKGIGESEKDMDPIPAKKKGGKITAANYDKEYGKIYRKAVKKMASGGSVSSASKRADGIAVKGKTRGKIC
jgi:hypothetical protein